jgi:hypothetical protein
VSEPPLRRRATDLDPRVPDDERLRRLVRFLAADPLHARWLARHNAKLLEGTARHLDLAGQHEAASRVRDIARAHRENLISPF